MVVVWPHRGVFAVDCPKCYNNVQSQVELLRQQVSVMREVVEYMKSRPAEPVNDTAFTDELTQLNDSVVQLWNDSMSHGNCIMTVV